MPCLTQIPANHRQQSVLAMPSRIPANHQQQMPHTDANKMGYIYIYIYSILPYLTWIPANHRQQILYLTMAHTHTRNSRAAKRSSCHASHIYQQITGKNRTSYHASDTSKSQATKHTCYAFHGNLQITGNKSYIFPLPHTNASNTQATHHTSYNVFSYRYQKITGHLANKSYILPCLTLIPANPGNKS